MRNMVIIGSLAAVLLSGCGPKKLALSSDPVDRAASCAVVSAIEARTTSTEVKGSLSYAAQTKIIHYAMLAASEGGTFSSNIAKSVVDKMSAVEAGISGGKWQDLQAPCAEAYPAALKTDGIELPKAKFDAQIGCYAMADFLSRSVQGNGPEGAARNNLYSDLKRKLDSAIGTGLKQRGASSYEKNQASKDQALAKMTNLGSPAVVAKLCTDRYS